MDPNLSRTLTAPSEMERAQVAKQQFNDFVAAKPSRQQLKQFMTERASIYFSQHKDVSRKERRQAAQDLGRRMQKKALNGELE